ncbi:MAG: thymidine phosphorylase [Candidatus Heimdallarchaeota archaeon]
MEFKIITHELEGVSSNYIVLNPKTALKNDLMPGTLLKTSDGKYGFRLITSSVIEQGLGAISDENLKLNSIKEGQILNFIPAGVEGVTRIIRRKMQKRTLTDTEIDTFIQSLNSGLLTNSHLASFGTAVEINGMQEKEIVSVAKSILNYSKKMEFPGKQVVDKHSIGGIAGNRITPIIVPIIASIDLKIPKVSTRAITSPAGTVDALEVVTNPNLDFDEAVEIVNKTNGCMVNGATVGLGDTADKFLSSVKQIKVDPREMMIASILAKKKAAGADFVIIDLPTGKGSKLESRDDARRLAYDFSAIGNKIDLKVECIISPGDKPIGTMIGPSLEMTEVLNTLEGNAADLLLKRKALSIAGLILENKGFADRGQGERIAEDILDSGKAYSIFKEIVEAQGGDSIISSKTIPKAPYNYAITADRDDIVYSLDSYNIGMMARAAGAPNDKMAGIVLHVDRGDAIKKGDKILEIHSHSEGKIDEAIAMMKTEAPIILEKSVLEHITGVQD